MTTGKGLPPKTREYLAHPSLAPLWAAVRSRLEKNRLAASGSVSLIVDDTGADLLSGMLATPVTAGVVRIRLDRLDARLRDSAAQAGLSAVVEALTGTPLRDRAAAREQSEVSRASVWARVDGAIAGAGLACAPWVPKFIDGVRQAGLLTRAGEETANRCADRTGAVLTALGTRTDLSAPDPGSPGPGPVWELAELASRCTGTAHGLDDGTLTSALVLRAAAAAFGEPVPDRAATRRALWERLGVVTDVLSGTVLAWGLRPPGTGPWSQMMRTRADLGLVTHLNVYELRATGPGALLASPGTVVSVCENPQVMQAAARAAVPGVLLCLSGNPASAGLLALDRLIADGNVVRYHGDFDWPGVAIAGRVLASGATPWRLTAGDYEEAVSSLPADEMLSLEGKSVPTPWDPALALVMARQGVAVHEESLLDLLLSDLV
jgi:uncharacterized protein (TIGR02679 family)